MCGAAGAWAATGALSGGRSSAARALAPSPGHRGASSRAVLHTAVQGEPQAHRLSDKRLFLPHHSLPLANKPTGPSLSAERAFSVSAETALGVRLIAYRDWCGDCPRGPSGQILFLPVT